MAPKKPMKLSIASTDTMTITNTEIVKRLKRLYVEIGKVNGLQVSFIAAWSKQHNKGFREDWTDGKFLKYWIDNRSNDIADDMLFKSTKNMMEACNMLHKYYYK